MGHFYVLRKKAKEITGLFKGAQTITFKIKNNTEPMKNAVFWDVAPYRYFVNRRFGGTYRLHLQDRKIR
jgi:hypothetical protein